MILPESKGHATKLLKPTSNSGRHVVYIFPLQDEIDTVPPPAAAPQFSKMLKLQCKTNGEILTLQVLALHVDYCSTSVENTEQIG